MPGKRLEITYDGRVLFADDVAEFTWIETGDGVSVKGSYQGKQGAATLGDLLNGLKSQSSARPAIPES